MNTLMYPYTDILLHVHEKCSKSEKTYLVYSQYHDVVCD